MKVTIMALALIILAGCQQKPPPPVPPPQNEDKSSVELKLDTEKGQVEIKKEE